jgi:hypothetical protein
VADALHGGPLYVFGPRMKTTYPYRGVLQEPTFRGLRAAIFSGEFVLRVPAGPAVAGNYALAVVCIRTDEGGLVAFNGLPVELSNCFTVR